ADYSLLNNAYISDEAIAGMIAATAIPAIAGAIVKGGDLGMQAVGGAMSGASQQTTQAASAASQGNFNMGNASLNNGSANNLSMGKVNTRMEYTGGGMSDTGADNVSHFRDGKGGEVINNSAAMQNIGTNLKASGSVSGSLSKTGEKLESASRDDMVAAGTSMNTAMSQYASLDHSHGRGTRTGTTDMTSSTAAFKESYAQEQNLVDEYAKKHGFNEAQKAEFAAYARAEAQGGVTVPFVGGVTATGGTSATATSSAQISAAQEEAKKFAHGQKYASAVEKSNQAMRSKDFAVGEDSGSKAAKGIKASLEESANSMQSASAKHTKADSYKEASTRVAENSAAFDTNANNQFMEWMKSQKNPMSDKNFTASDVEQMSRTNNLGGFAQRFINEELTPKAVDQYMPTPQNNIQAKHDENAAKIPTQQDVQKKGNDNLTNITGQQAATGLTPGVKLANTVAPAVSAQIGKAGAAIEAGKGAVVAGGQPIQGEVTKTTTPGNVSVAGRAAGNAVGSVSPSAASLLNDAGVLPEGSMAKQEADARGGTVKDHLIGLGTEVALTVAGGAVGRVAGKGISKIAGLGKGAGDVAQKTTLEVAEKAAAREAALAKKAEGGAAKPAAHEPAPVEAKPVEAPSSTGSAAKVETPAAEGGAAKPAAHEPAPVAEPYKPSEATIKNASNTGARADVETTKTATGIGLTGGAIGGNAIGQAITGGLEKSEKEQGK
ncbi:MAG: hypothetical protein ACXWTX_05895, partial [Gallionella sp.]